MLRLGVIGIGRMGSMHAERVAKGLVDGAVLAAVCDVDEKALGSFTARFGVVGYTDYRALIRANAVDAVIIATPHYSHVEIACFCIENGIHTLVEKPISVTAQAARKLTEVSLAHPQITFGIMYNQRTNPVYRKAKQLMAEGAIGALQRVSFITTDWYRTQAYFDCGGWRASWSGEGGGALINQCVHQIDVLQWLIGLPDSVLAHCRTINRQITVENDVDAIWYYPNFHVMFSASTHEATGTVRLELVGDKGRLEITPTALNGVLLRSTEAEINAATKEVHLATSGVDGLEYTTVTETYTEAQQQRDAERGQQTNVIEAFVAAVNGKQSLVADGKEGIRALQLINAMYLSSWKNATVAFPVDEDEYAAALEAQASLENKKITT